MHAPPDGAVLNVCFFVASLLLYYPYVVLQVFVCKALLEEQAKVQVYDPQVKRSQMFVEFDYTCGVNKDNTPRLEESVRAERGKEHKK